MSKDWQGRFFFPKEFFGLKLKVPKEDVGYSIWCGWTRWCFRPAFFPPPWGHLSHSFWLETTYKMKLGMCPLLTAKWAIALLLCNKCHHYKNLSEIQCVICFDSCTQLKIFLAYLKKNSLSKIHLGIISHVFFMRFPSYLRTFQKPKPGTIGTQEGKEGEHLLQLVLVTRTFCGSAELHLVFF